MCHENSVHGKLLFICTIFLFCLIFFPIISFARSKEFTLSCPYWEIRYDRAGYVDITYWHPSPRHPFAFHEMMTGDWAAAVYYEGIDTSSNQAAWLTDKFVVPDINSTNSPFDFIEYNVSNESINPHFILDKLRPICYI